MEKIIYHILINMIDMKVTQEGKTILISEGVFQDKKGDHGLEAVSFDIEGEVENNIVYDLYIVDNKGTYEYVLEKVYITPDMMPMYQGAKKLIHNFINVDINGLEPPLVTIKRVIKEVNQNEDNAQNQKAEPEN